MRRSDNRKDNQLRKVVMKKNYVRNALGSCLISFGKTRVLCAATVEESVPPFLKNSGTGWVTAEYGMLPASCSDRIRRNNPSGRIYEIQRLIGRSLRSAVDMALLGERTVRIDCDVIDADGGTRTAAVTGGFVALALALKDLKQRQVLSRIPLRDYVAAVSVGLMGNRMLLDLKYDEDVRADMDMNVVMRGSNQLVEVQGTAEGQTFSRSQCDRLISLAQKGIRELIRMQKSAVGPISLLREGI